MLRRLALGGCQVRQGQLRLNAGLGGVQGNTGDGSSNARGGRGYEIMIENDGGGGGGPF